MNALLKHVWGKSPARDRAWAQVTGIAPSKAVGRLLMALNFQAFLDESITAGGEFVMAGHIATAESWAQFSQEWEELLPLGTRSKNGQYHFKMSEMALTAERMERVPVFYKLIEKHVITSISCRMNLVDFGNAFERLKPIALNFGWKVNFSHWQRPYYFVFRSLLDKFHAERERFASSLPLDRKVDFVFDDHTEKRPILDAWDEYMEMRDEALKAHYGATPRFENDQDFLPLQAADLWAWWVREWYEWDASHVPDKLRDFDFGKWRGKPRTNIAMSMDEDHIVDFLQATMLEHAAISAEENESSSSG